jgi:hypothetical protein
MCPYFTRERFGRPQFLAGLLLLAFLVQAAWLVHMETRAANPPDRDEASRIGEGWRQWHREAVAGAPLTGAMFSEMQGPEIRNSPEVANEFDTDHSPLLYLVAAAPLLAWPQSVHDNAEIYWRWLPRLPFLACGVLLGASLWYVARRLCGNTGGLIALTFYCFSPSLIQASAVWHTEPEIVAAWGAFGSVFTAIAVAHTLYAPREVVLWNWRRIVLLGVSFTIAVGSQFSMIVLLPIALGFLLYVAPVRKRAATVIWISACMVGFILLFSLYFFHRHPFAESLRNADFWGATWRGFAVAGVYKQVGALIGRACPAFLLALPVAVAAYVIWPRTRYFGNTTPLLVALLFVILAMAHPHSAGAGFLLAAIPFLFVFVAGVLADLLETRYRPLMTAGIVGMLIAYVTWSVLNLTRVQPG